MKRLAYCLMILAILAMACNLGAAGGGNPGTSGGASTSTPAPFSPVEPPAFASSLAASLRARVASGEWTLEEGLTHSLKFLAGEEDLSAVQPQGSQIQNLSGGRLLAMAHNYLQTGSDEAAKAEIRRLVALILPDPARLKLYSEPYLARAAPASIALASFSSDTVDCRGLWEEGFEPGSAVVCFEDQTVVTGSGDYDIYFPSSWLADDPRREYLDWTAEAIQDAALVYEGYGPLPSSGTVVFTLLRDPEFPTAEGATAVWDEGGPCQIAILPPSFAAEETYFKQVVAHELFHCWQFNNHWAETWADGADWWVEGTAEYFANVVYPSADAERMYWGEFDVESIGLPLLDMDYANEVFFQYLGDRFENRGVLALIDGMPSSGGRAAQLASLAAYPDIDSIFLAFAEAYLDQDIADTFGPPISIAPRVDRERIFSDSHTETISTRSFLLARALFVFPQGKQHSLIEEKPDEVTTVAEPRGIHAGWQPMITEIAAACDEIHFVYAATLTSTSDSGEDVSVTSSTTDFDGECDRCVVGTWKMDDMSHWDAFAHVISSASAEAAPNLESISGDVTARFSADGRMSVTFDNFDIHYTQDFGGIHADSTLDVNGLFTSFWYTDAASGSLFSMDPSNTPIYVAQSVITQGGHSTTVNLDTPLPWGGISFYQCSGDTLQIDSFSPTGVDGQYVTYDRVH